MRTKYTDLHNDIVEWGKDRGIVKKGNEVKQLLKCAAECGELADGICKNNLDEIKDGIGDVMVPLILFGKVFGITLTDDVLQKGIERSRSFLSQSEVDAMFNLLTTVSAIYEHPSEMILTKAICWLNVVAIKNDIDLVDCLQVAYDEIKDRTGTEKDGVFIKDE